MQICFAVIPAPFLSTKKANLIYDHKLDTHIMYYNETREEWRDIQCGYICYKLDGEKLKEVLKEYK